MYNRPRLGCLSACHTSRSARYSIAEQVLSGVEVRARRRQVAANHKANQSNENMFMEPLSSGHIGT